jgi:hypothetical protein
MPGAVPRSEAETPDNELDGGAAVADFAPERSIRMPVIEQHDHRVVHFILRGQIHIQISGSI